jgi:hypothetical protein
LGAKPHGGQAGHAGQPLMALDHPDRPLTHEVPSCAYCQASLQGIEVVGYDERQVSDTPTARRYRRETHGVQVPWPSLSVRGPRRRSGLCREGQARVTLNERCKTAGGHTRALTSAS